MKGGACRAKLCQNVTAQLHMRRARPEQRTPNLALDLPIRSNRKEGP
jgi:hypothetical protein